MSPLTRPFLLWGGEDSNLRPADYEFDRPRLAGQAKRSKHRLSPACLASQHHPTLRNVSRSFAGQMRDTSPPGAYLRMRPRLLISPSASGSRPGLRRNCTKSLADAFFQACQCVMSHLDPHFQPGTRPTCSIHLCISGPCTSSRVFTLTYRVRSVVPSGGGGSNSAPPKKTTFTETS